MKAELVPENGDPPIPILRDLTLLGRHPDCDVIVDHPSLSKRHCMLVKTDGLLVIRDLATTNGTKVKGQRVRWAALLPEDKVSFGAYKVRIYLGSDEMPSPSEQQRVRNGGNAVRKNRSQVDPLNKTEVSPATVSPRAVVPAGFAAPSADELPSGSWDDDGHTQRFDQITGPDSRSPHGGFELVDDDDAPGAAASRCARGRL